jgi:hypothetical protein
MKYAYLVDGEYSTLEEAEEVKGRMDKQGFTGEIGAFIPLDKFEQIINEAVEARMTEGAQ